MNVDAELQSAVLSISGMETPVTLALEVAAPLVECAVKYWCQFQTVEELSLNNDLWLQM